MKELVQHLLKNNFDEILKDSLTNCHAIGLHSIMLLHTPEKTIRLFVTDTNHELTTNNRLDFIDGKPLSIAFHPHHCNLTLHCVKGNFLNWVVEETEDSTGFQIKKFLYQSAITKGEMGFKFLGDTHLVTTSEKVIDAGEYAYMPANELHTVTCVPNAVSAWFVYEGKENPLYSSICYSNSNLASMKTDERLYQKMQESDIYRLLDLAELI